MAIVADYLAAQNSVIGAALLEPDVIPKILAKTTESDFSGVCRTIYSAIRRLFLDGRPADVVSLAAYLGEEYRQTLVDLMEVTPTAKNVDIYIDLCKKQAKILAAQDVGRQLSEMTDLEEIRGALESAGRRLMESGSRKVVTMEDALKSFMNRQQIEAKYLTWPVAELNDRIYSEPGDFIIIAGYPSAGKSAWALQCAWHWAETYRVGFFSLETSPEKLFDRQIAGLAGVSMENIKRRSIPESQWSEICCKSGRIIDRKMEIVPAAGMTVADIRSMSVIRRYEIVVIDYLQLLQAPGRNRVEQVTSISIDLHTMAQSLGVTVVALSQLSRPSTMGGAPGMSSLRESGQIEQDADLIQILYLQDNEDPDGFRVLKIAKNKEGTRPNILLDFDGAHQTFRKASSDGCQRHPRRGADFQQMKMLPDDLPVPFD